MSPNYETKIEIAYQGHNIVRAVGIIPVTSFDNISNITEVNRTLSLYVFQKNPISKEAIMRLDEKVPLKEALECVPDPERLRRDVTYIGASIDSIAEKLADAYTGLRSTIKEFDFHPAYIPPEGIDIHKDIMRLIFHELKRWGIVPITPSQK